MTSIEMLYEFRFGFDVLASNLAPGFTNNEIYTILNRSYDNLILDLVKAKNLVGLGTLLRKSVEYTPSTDANGMQYIDLPIDFFIYFDSYSKLSRSFTDENSGFIQVTEQSNEYIDNDLIDSTDASQFFETEYNKHRYYKKPKVFTLYNNRLYILPDSFTTIGNITLIYVKEKSNITAMQDCSLSTSLHRPLVERAIDIAKVIINSQMPQQTN